MKTDELIGPTLSGSRPNRGRTEPPPPNDLEGELDDRSLDREKGGESPSSSSSTDGAEFDVKWDGAEDPENPRSMTKTKKWICTCVVSLGSLCV